MTRTNQETHNNTMRTVCGSSYPAVMAAAKTRYLYPESFGDCGETLSDRDYSTMADWPAMPEWYRDAMDNGYEGTYDEYVYAQQSRCTPID